MNHGLCQVNREGADAAEHSQEQAPLAFLRTDLTLQIFDRQVPRLQ